MSTGQYIQREPGSLKEYRRNNQEFDDDETPAIERHTESAETNFVNNTGHVKFETDPELEAQVAAEREQYEKQRAKAEAEDAKASRAKSIPMDGQLSAVSYASKIPPAPNNDQADIAAQQKYRAIMSTAQSLGGIAIFAWLANFTPIVTSESISILCKIIFYLLSIICAILIIVPVLKSADKTVPETMHWPFVMASLVPGFAVRYFLYDITASFFSGNQTIHSVLCVIFWTIGAAIHYMLLRSFEIKPPTHLAVTYALLMLFNSYLYLVIITISTRNIRVFTDYFNATGIILALICLAIDLIACLFVPSIHKLRHYRD